MRGGRPPPSLSWTVNGSAGCDDKDDEKDDNDEDDDGDENDDDDDLYIIGAVCLSVRHKSDYFQIFSKISKFSKNFKI